MDAAARATLEQMLVHGSPAYVELARRLLDGELELPSPELSHLFDGFLNDPHLTRNRPADGLTSDQPPRAPASA